MGENSVYSVHRENNKRNWTVSCTKISRDHLVAGYFAYLDGTFSSVKSWWSAGSGTFGFGACPCGW